MRIRLHHTVLVLLTGLIVLSLDLQAQEAPTEQETSSDSLLLDATWIPCSDSTESLHILRNGETIYACANSGVSFTIGQATLKGLIEVIDAMKSVTDTAVLDSCTTIGVILAGPRYLLLNSSSPTEITRSLCNELAMLRKYAKRRIERDIERTLEYIEQRPNTGVKTDPALDPETLNRSLYNSPIASTWRCRGSVRVTAQIDARGNVRRAFVQNADVDGKCASLLVMTSLRAVTLSSFEPAVKIEGNSGAAWMNIVVSFGRRSVTSMEQSMSQIEEPQPPENESSSPEAGSPEE
ncbi:MAG: hypothetical protein J4G05_07215 [Chlorobi bacterium]|nr:hypothetical protein [Chlorobiota bacterium]